MNERGQWSLKGLGWKLGIKSNLLEELARHAPRLYHPYVKKRPGKKDRQIANPSRTLKEVQRKIYQILLRPVEVPDYLHGGVGGRSPLTNALQHLDQRYVVRIDIRDFFPSITDRQVYDVWQELGYGSQPASVLTALTTFRARLPQGAPTSTALANLVLLAPDSKIQKLAELEGCRFTRFVDDLAVSGERPQNIINSTVEILMAAGFRVSRKKLVVMRASELQELTGLGINSSQGPSVPRYRISRVRTAIFQLKHSECQEQEISREKIDSVKGRIRHIEKTNPGSASALRKQLLKKLA